MTRLCPEVIWGKFLDKGAVGEGPEGEVGFWQQYVCMGGGISNPVHLKVPDGVGDHAHGFTQIDPGPGPAGAGSSASRPRRSVMANPRGREPVGGPPGTSALLLARPSESASRPVMAS